MWLQVVCERLFLCALGFWRLTHLRTEEAAFLVHLPSPFPSPVSILLTYTLLSLTQFVTHDNTLLKHQKIKALQVSSKSPVLGEEERSVPPQKGTLQYHPALCTSQRSPIKERHCNVPATGQLFFFLYYSALYCHRSQRIQPWGSQGRCVQNSLFFILIG